MARWRAAPAILPLGTASAWASRTAIPRRPSAHQRPPPVPPASRAGRRMDRRVRCFERRGYIEPMLNRNDPAGDLAVVRYGDHDYTVIRNGRFVRCAVSGAMIALEDLRYW